MVEVHDYYPPAPAAVPANLTTPTSGYRARVLVVFSSLFLFGVLYAGLLLGSAFLCWYAFATVAGGSSSKSFWREFGDITHAEQRILGVYNAAARQGQGAGTDQALLSTIEGNVLPAWRDLRQRLDRLSGVPWSARDAVNQYRQYLKLREESLELLARFLRQNDRNLAAQVGQRMDAADRAGRELSAAFARVRPSSGDGDSVVWLVIVGIASAVLCLFLIKGFFKRRNTLPPLRVEVSERDQPILFGFIRQLCLDTGAPFPRRVYLTGEVNAAVFYEESVLSLFLPTSKNLLIGLGLVNHLNLSEFKAVLAHEFGHFSQSSMKLGSYVYMSNRIVADLVFGRDWLDDVLATLNRIDFRIAVFAWAFTGILWALRKTLQGLFHMINFAHSALSRQMEYNADLVAVSVTGSDALIHALARLNFAQDCLNQAWTDLTAAGDHQLFSRDVFSHQRQEAAYLRVLLKDPRLGDVPALPADPEQSTQIFQPEDTAVPAMWATHPSNYDRETNAKRQYIRSPIDERSSWILFQDADSIRETLTRQIYQAVRPNEQLDLKAPEMVQAFIDEEHAETTYDARYHGLFDNRYLTPGTVDELMGSPQTEFTGAVPAQLAQAHAQLYGDELKQAMETHRSRQKEYNLLAGLVHGAVELTSKDFSFRGARCTPADARRCLDQVQKELDEDTTWMSRLDRQILLIHHEMARHLEGVERQELEERYRFHMAAQEMHRLLASHNQQIHATLNQLAGVRDISQEEFQSVLAIFRQAHDDLAEGLDRSSRLRVPVMKNLTDGMVLSRFLLPASLVPAPSTHTNSLDGTWVNQFLSQLAEVLDKLRRVHFKSVGGILTLQEKIAERWTALQANPPTEQVS